MLSLLYEVIIMNKKEIKMRLIRGITFILLGLTFLVISIIKAMNK